MTTQVDKSVDHWSLVEQLATDEHQAARSVLREAGMDAIDAMIKGLSHPHWRVRMHCAGFMDHLAINACIAPLIPLVDDENHHVRRMAIHSLSCQACKVSPLELSSSEKQVAIASLKREINDKHRRIRVDALYALFEVDVDEQQQIEEFIPIALEMLSDRSGRVRRAAARCLCQFPNHVPLRPVLRVFLKETRPTTYNMIKRLVEMILNSE